jgi:glycosyltransferase involved in cell wall biosynthesis
LSLPLVSVIIPTFNRAHVLKRAIDSVVNQTYKNIELIIVNDGSTDDTLSLLEHYQAKVFTTKNLGVSAARNLGIKNATGQWIAFLDSDDQWLLDKIEKQINYSLINPHINIIHGDEIWIRNGKRVNPKNKHKKGGGDQFSACIKLCAISPSVVMIKKEIFDEIGLFDENYPCCEDYDLWLRITSKMEVGYLDEFLINKYGGHEDQLSRKFKAMDYWRVKSLDSILKSDELSYEKYQIAKEELKIKATILLKGYEKHNNYSAEYHEVKNIFNLYFS